jgi:hypothetical protein
MKKIKYHKKTTSGYKLPKTELKGMEAMLDLLILILWTAYVFGEKIVSFLFLSDPESGKTTLMQKIRHNVGVHVLRRFTAYGFIKDLMSGRSSILFKKSKIFGHILTYEFANIFTYKAESVNTTIEFLNALTEEGLANETSYWIQGDALNEYLDLKGGIIGGINPFGFFTSMKTKNVRANLYRSGCISRIPIASYSISSEGKKRVFDSITRGDYRQGNKFREKIIENFPKKRIQVKLPKVHARKIRDLAVKVAEEYSKDLKDHAITGFRLQKILISLVKASALRDGRTIVNRRDVDRITYLSQWMNLKMNALKPDYPFR